MRSSLYIKALFGNTADWMVGGSLTLGANCWNSVFPNGVSSFQFNKQAICLRTEWQSNFWTVDGCLCAHVLMHTYKATQTCVLQTSQIHSWLASSPSLAPCVLLHLEQHSGSWSTCTHGAVLGQNKTGYPLPLFSVTQFQRARVPRSHAKRGLEVGQKYGLSPVGQ